MTLNPPSLEWLSPEQALRLLQGLNKKLTMDDMFGYCAELKLFPAYVRLRMAEGEIPDDRSTVYGVGDYIVANPDDLFHGKQIVTLTLHGNVLSEPDIQSSWLRDVDWEHTAERNNFRILFKRSDLESLSSESVPAGTEPPLNHLAIISILTKMLIDDTRPSYNQSRVIKEINEKYGHVLGLGPSTLRTLFSNANKVRKSLPCAPSDSSKIRLDKTEIQLD